MTRIHLVTGLLVRSGEILLVASHYAGRATPLWNLPGGRQEPGELLRDALVREFREEVALNASVGKLLYVSESYDGDVHFTNFTFAVEAAGEPRMPHDVDHIADVGFFSAEQVEHLAMARVVREPLRDHLADGGHRYYGYAAADVSIEWPDAST